MYAFGVGATYKHSFRATSETFAQIFNMSGIYYLLISSPNDLTFISALKSFELVIFIRLTRILSLLYELKTFRVIIETIKNLLGPFYTLLLVQFTIFYAFGMTGVLWFGGRVTSETMSLKVDTSYASTYFLNNFNDLGNGFVTLFSLMVVNNWQFVSQVFVDITGTTATRFFFVAFYYICVVIGLNIVVAFAIDMFSAISRLDAA